MKKLLMVAMTMLFCGSCFAGEFDGEIQKLQSDIAQYQQAIQARQVRLIEIQGVLKYQEQKEKEVKELETEGLEGE